MSFQLSPGVLVVEKDLTNVIPAVATTIGGFVGDFAWGPVLEPVSVTSELQLVREFGKPNSTNAVSFFSAANFLGYSNNLLLVRAVGSTAKNAVSTGTAVLVKNTTEWETSYSTGQATVGEFAAKYPGTLGNSLQVSMADSATFTGWDFEDQFDSAPGTSEFAANVGGSQDELHIVVVDEDGIITGVPGTILEKFSGLSKAVDAKTEQGAKNYYVDVLKDESKYIWWMDHTTSVEVSGTAWGSEAAGTTFKLMSAAVDVSLTGGVDASPASGDLQDGYDLFINAETLDVNLLITGGASLTDAAYVISDIAEVRRDCLVFVSPQLTSKTASAVVTDRNTLNANSSFAVMDSGWKYQYDKYNDQYRWIPLNADIAGICARTDLVADAWFSPAGLDRGQVKNVVKLSWSPNKADRDTLYKNSVNPVVTFLGEGTVLYGDKTLLKKPSAFDRINVRRLFIILEKAIAVAGKYQLFEFNDAFTRAQFLNLVEPFLRDVQGRRGIFDFRVICDDTNNTGEVIDRNEFVADIYIKPARSINFITLNFVATRTGVEFSEVVGA